MTKKIFISTTWTCIRRKLDARRFANYFSKNDHKIVNDPQKADIIILVTCADTNRRTEQSLGQVKKFMKYDAELIVAGCLPAIDKEKLEEIFDGKTVVTKEIEKIDDFFPENKIKFSETEDANIPWENRDESKPYDALKKIFRKSRFTNNFYNGIKNYIRKSSIWDSAVFSWYGTVKENPYFIRPSRGCLGNCSYCAIKKAIGRMKSKPLDTCIAEFKKGLSQGYKYFVFDADDIGCYGIDNGDGDSNLPKLLNEITNIPGDYQIDVHYVRPQWVIKYIDYFEEILKKGRIRRMGSSIQSGNSRILKLMHRYPDTEKMKDTFLRLKKVCLDLLLETECIVGFPTETMEEFRETMKFIQEVHFGWGVLFPFSCKLGTEAEHLEPKVPEGEILKRMKYAKKFLRKCGYDVRYAKYFRRLSQNIIVYSDIGLMPNVIRKK